MNYIFFWPTRFLLAKNFVHCNDNLQTKRNKVGFYREIIYLFIFQKKYYGQDTGPKKSSRRDLANSWQDLEIGTILVRPHEVHTKSFRMG